MTYEKGIPDYAMVPAREAEERVLLPVSKDAVYSSVQATNLVEKPKTVITVEEDVLVPDTRPDMAEILWIGGKVHLTNKEITKMQKTEDYVSLSGEMELQTLYLPEKEETCGPVIAVQTRIPFKERWHTAISDGAVLLVHADVESIDSMVVNERKYRVKISLAVYAQEYTERSIELLEGISGEEIQMQHEKIEITTLTMRKTDALEIKEDLDVKAEASVETILSQDIRVVENYKQVTGDKVIVNGFLIVGMLYSCREESEDCENLHQAQVKTEFTQFIPLQPGEDAAAGSNVAFDVSNLRVKIAEDQESGEVVRMEGELLTSIEVYCNTQKEIISDAYHREKDFICDFREEKCGTFIGNTMGEASAREIFSPQQAGEVERILYSTGQLLQIQNGTESGKVVTEGTLMIQMICICRTAENTKKIIPMTEKLPFRIVSSMPQIQGDEMIRGHVYLKDLWVEKINGKQIECNASLLAATDVMRMTSFRVLTNPAFEQNAQKTQMPPMVVYITGKNDRLWDIAKKYKTTTETIAKVNELEDEALPPGKKLLILR